jgi:hypothetical protein
MLVVNLKKDLLYSVNVSLQASISKNFGDSTS